MNEHEYAKNKQYYESISDTLIDDHWYIIDQQRIVTHSIDKEAVISALQRLPSDDYYFAQKGNECPAEEVPSVF